MRLLTLFMAALCALFAQAATNQMGISNFLVLSGDTLLMPVTLENESEISAFQCDVFLPQGITVALNEEEDLDVTLNSERATSSHSITARIQDDGSIRLAAYSSQSKKFKGNSGELFYLNLVTDADVEGEMDITLKNIICSTADAEEIAVNDTKGVVTLAKYIPKNDFVLNDTAALGGTSIVLPVVLNNESEISAFQCDIYLPEGITLPLNDEEDYDITLNSERATSSHTLSARLQDDGSIRLVAYSSQSKSFKGNEGTLFYLRLATDMKHFGAQQILIKNIICSTEEAKTITVNEVKSQFTILRPVDALTLDQTTVELIKGETVTLTATATPEEADNKAVVWSSSDEAVATVADGVVTTLKVGEAVITATTTDGTNLTASCTVTVKPVLVASLTLDQTTKEVIKGESFTLTVTATPDEADNKAVVWSSSDEAVATVADGVVTTLKVGEAVITATTTDGTNLTASCTVTVKPVLLTSITLNIIELTLEVGETAQLTATMTPEEADDKTVIWSSSDEAVVTVDDAGLVTYVKEGTATITATAADGSGVTATCAVVAKPDGIATIVSDGIATTTYYSVVSEASDTPHKGLNIIKRAYKNGRVEISKEIIK